MKKIFLLLLITSFVGVIIFISCKKDPLCEGCINGNRPPIANAGPDQVITLPTDSISLDGSASHDPDGTINIFIWKKISGPVSGSLGIAITSRTNAKNLVEGNYQFELKVTDDRGLIAKDTINVIVIKPPTITITCPPANRPLINAQLISIGNLSVGRYYMAAVSAGNKLFFAGGKAPGSGNLSSRVDIYDISSQSWSTSELSMPRWHLSAVAAGDKVFFAGGSSTGVTSRVDIYNLTTNTWTIAELSQARDGIETATLGNKVFFAGGFSGVSRSSRVDIYDLSTNAWSIANLSEAKTGFTATAVGNKIYFAGGVTNSGPTSNKIDIYDNMTDSWSTSTLNTGKGFHAAIFQSGKIYWAGGATHIDYQGGIGNEDLITCDLEIKDVNTQISSFANLSNPKYFNGAFEKENKIVFISLYGGWQYWQDFDIYDTGSDSWSIGLLPQAISSYASIISVNNVIYVAGGINPGNTGYSNQVLKLEF